MTNHLRQEIIKDTVLIHPYHHNLSQHQKGQLPDVSHEILLYLSVLASCYWVKVSFCYYCYVISLFTNLQSFFPTTINKDVPSICKSFIQSILYDIRMIVNDDFST